MSQNKRRRLSNTRRGGRLRWSARAAAAASITIGMISAGAHPAAAHSQVPAPGAKGPDGGSLPPDPMGAIAFPTAPQPITAPPADAIGPLAQEIMAASAAAERLGEQLKVVDDEVKAAKLITGQYRTAWAAEVANLEAVQARAAAIAGEAYKGAAAMGPFEDYANDLQNLSLIAPALPGSLDQQGRPPERDSIGYELATAERNEQAAKAALTAAEAAEKEITDRRAVVSEQFERHRAALKTLQTRNASLLGTLEAARNTYEDSLALSRGLGTSINGLQAAPRAQQAVAFALSQRGKPYEWAAEGPSTYDCSGLMLASYLTVGVRLPRVSRFQYGAGTPVLASQLLPGDLLFFSTDKYDWRQIHHVAMYIGGGKMVQAPTFGDVVKVSPVWWSEYFGAVRVIPAVAGPTTATTTTPPPTTTAPPTTTPPATTTPATTTNPPAATNTPTPTPTRTTTPTPTPTTQQPTGGTTTTGTTTTGTTTTGTTTTGTTTAGSTTTTGSTSGSPLPAAVTSTTAHSTGRRSRWSRRR